MKKTFIPTLVFIVLLSMLAVSTSAAVGDNLCLGATVVDYSGAVMAEDEQIGSAIDGDIDTKWCSVGMLSEDQHLLDESVENWIVLDLGESKYFNRYQLFHGSLCKRDFGETQYDTRSWILEVSDDLENWKEVSRVSGNTADHNDVEIELTCARYVRLLIVDADQIDGNTITRISEFKVIESDDGGTVSGNSAEDYLAELEKEKQAKDLEIRKSLIFPAILYWCFTAIMGGVVFFSVRAIKRKNKKA